MSRAWHFCGVGGSGMLPLALTLKARGDAVTGSDRAFDQGRTLDKLEFLRAHGIGPYPQDGSGVTRAEQTLVVSAAVEEGIPDVQAARRVGARIVTRAELLSELFNAAPLPIGVAGTSGKSTTTAMIGWILHATGTSPTIVNGAVMTNFATPETPWASAVPGKGAAFVAEVDESDGSIARYEPAIAVLNNVSLDHKSMDELRQLFGGFVGKAKTAVVNLDDAEAAALAAKLPAARKIGYSLETEADVWGQDLMPAPDGILFTAVDSVTTAVVTIKLKVPGKHNVENALAALCAAKAAGVALAAAGKALESFAGVRRRLETVGSAGGITVIDDFAHNPDKIAASLATLKAFPGRLLVLFQPHGYGPLKLMREGFVESFAAGLGPDDVLLMAPPADYGGTTERTLEHRDAIVAGVRARKRQAHALADRAAGGYQLRAMAQPGDRIVVMGARDDTLTTFARDLLAELESQTGNAATDSVAHTDA